MNALDAAIGISDANNLQTHFLRFRYGNVFFFCINYHYQIGKLGNARKAAEIFIQPVELAVQKDLLLLRVFVVLAAGALFLHLFKLHDALFDFREIRQDAADPSLGNEWLPKRSGNRFYRRFCFSLRADKQHCFASFSEFSQYAGCFFKQGSGFF